MTQNIFPIFESKSGLDWKPRSNWKEFSISLNESGDSICIPRDYQIEPIKRLAASKGALLKAPTGAGKSIMMMLGSKLKQLENPKLKFLYAAPQKIIGQGFNGIVEIFGNKVEPTSLCDDSGGKVNELVSWILDPHEASADDSHTAYYVCTHSTLVYAWKTLKELDQLDKLSNICLFIDEVHHVSGEDSNDFSIRNMLGRLITEFRQLDDCQVHGCTATYLRGDKNPILSPDQVEEIIVKIEDYLAETQIKSISFHISLCDSYENGMDNILSAIIPDNRVAVFIPHTKTLGGVDEKLEFVQNIIDKQKRHLGNNSVILDFVSSDETKEIAQKAIGDGSNNDSANIINCMNMFKEGANWKALDTIVIMGERNLNEMGQILGRALRDCGQEKYVKLYLLIDGLSLNDQDKLKEGLNNYFKAIMLLQCGITNFVPVNLDKFYSKSDKEKIDQLRKSGVSEYKEIIDKLFVDENDLVSFRKDILQEAVDYLSENDYSDLKKSFPEIVSTVLKDNDKNEILSQEELEVLSLGLLAENRRQTFFSQFKKLDDLDINVLDEDQYIFDWIFAATKPFGFDSYKKVREFWSKFGEFLSFEEAKKFAITNNITSSKDWKNLDRSFLIKNNLPRNPDQVYSNEWVSWEFFLGKEKAIYLDYQSAKTFVNNLKLSNVEKWYEYCASGIKPKNIPSNPNQVYKNEWESFDIWLNKTSHLKEFMPFEKARIHAQSLKLSSQKQWYTYIQSNTLINNLPHSPDAVYKDSGWMGWPDFLQNNTKQTLTKNNKKSYSDIKDLCKELKIYTLKEYEAAYVNGDLPIGCPRILHRLEGWSGAGDFFGGKKSNRNNWLDFESAKEIVKSKKLSSYKEYLKWCTSEDKPYNIPNQPDRVYKDKGWTNWFDFLGK